MAPHASAVSSFSKIAHPWASRWVERLDQSYASMRAPRPAVPASCTRTAVLIRRPPPSTMALAKAVHTPSLAVESNTDSLCLDLRSNRGAHVLRRPRAAEVRRANRASGNHALDRRQNAVVEVA